MTQLTQTLNNFSLKPLSHILLAVANFFIILGNAYVEARTRQAAYELAKVLKHNRDFANYSEMELFHMIIDRNLDSVNKTKG
jgi:hypothetical protein